MTPRTCSTREPPDRATCGIQAAAGESACASTSTIRHRQRELFLAAMRATAQVVDFERALLAVRHPDSDSMTVVACSGTGPPTEGGSWCRSGAMIGPIVDPQRAVRYADAEELAALDGGLPLVRAGFRSLLCAPVVGQGTVVGALVLVSRSETGFDDNHLPFLLEVGRQLALVLEEPADRVALPCLDCHAQPSDPCPHAARCGRRGALVVESSALEAVMATVARVAPTEATVLLLGESGTGKELVAREIHRLSTRSRGPLVAVNCACVPRELFESEFFGHVRGAFTGALRDRAGRFQLADGGTLLLDEVAEIPLDLQAKLLRVLQEGRFERVGEEHPRSADVRVVAATNRDLAAEVDAGRFRSDLFFRLSVIPIELPPLRAQPESVLPLARHFVGRFAAELGVPAPVVDEEAERHLRAYSWPGNVRELQNVVERAVILSRNGRLRLDLGSAPQSPRNLPAPGETTAVLTDAEIRNLERANLEAALRVSNGKVYGRGGAAALLGVPPTTLADRMRRFGVDARSCRRAAGDGPRSR